MKIRLLLSVIVFAFLVGSASSQSVFTENFAYPAGDSLGAHGWVSFSGGMTNRLMVTSPGLTFTGYALSNIGNSTYITKTGQDAYDSLGTSYSSGTFYIAYMVKIDTARTGDYFAALLPPTSTTTFTARMYARDTAGTISFGLSKGAASGGSIVYGANGFAYNSTIVVIVKYVFNTGSTSDDEMDLYVFNSSIPNSPPSSPYVGPITGTVTDAAAISRIALRQGQASSSPSLYLDGIMATTSWSDFLTNSIRNISTVAGDFSLSQNYPNPFNPSTSIKFSIPSNGNVNLKVYNLLGKEVSSLVNGNLNSGVYSVDFNGANLSSGTYIYRLNYNGANGKVFSDVKKLTLIK